MTRILMALLFTVAVVGAKAGEDRAIEIFGGGSVYQFNRLSYLNIQTGENSHTVNMSMRNVAYTGTVGLTGELSNVFALDGRVSVGSLETEHLVHAQLGLQMRMGYWFNSGYIDPYVRVGVGFLAKGYRIEYTDVLQHRYEFENVHNKDGKDADISFPFTAGVGVNMWLNDHFGIGIAGDYMYVPEVQVANSLIGSVNLIFRIGGKTKRPAPIVEYVDKVVYQKVPEIKEVVRVVEKEKVVMAENPVTLLSQVTFDYNSYALSLTAYDIIRKAASLMQDGNWLITGFTDAKGSDKYNDLLSLRRAEAVRDALIENGVVAVKAVGKGKRIANAGTSQSDEVRKHDRKTYVEEVTDINYWNLF